MPCEQAQSVQTSGHWDRIGGCPPRPMTGPQITTRSHGDDASPAFDEMFCLLV